MLTRLRKLLFYNFITKILALFLGMLLYFYVLSEQNPIIEKIFSMNVELRGLESGVMPLKVSPPMVTLKLQGPRQVISTLNSSQIEVYVDAVGVKEGTFQLPVHIKTLPELEVLSYAPQKVHLKLDRLVEQKFVIEANKIGKLPENFAIEKEEVKPETCIVKGAKSRLARVRHVLATIEISNATSAIKKEVRLRPIDEEGRDVTDVIPKPSVAEVYLKVSLLFPKEVSVVENIIYPTAPYKLKSITISPNRILIQGAKEKLQRVSVIKTAPIDLSDAQGNQSFYVSLMLPNAIKSEVQEVKVSAVIVKEEEALPAPPQ